MITFPFFQTDFSTHLMLASMANVLSISLNTLRVCFVVSHFVVSLWIGFVSSHSIFSFCWRSKNVYLLVTRNSYEREESEKFASNVILDFVSFFLFLEKLEEKKGKRRFSNIAENMICPKESLRGKSFHQAKQQAKREGRNIICIKLESILLHTNEGEIIKQHK